MLNELVDQVTWVPASFRIKVETNEMSKLDVSNILKDLNNKQINTALVAVMGGRFSEGVDYSGGVLSSAITVGLPLRLHLRGILRQSSTSRNDSGGKRGGVILLLSLL